MLEYQPDFRIKASEAILHNWIQKKAPAQELDEIAVGALHNLMNFRAELKLQQAAITFIVQQLAPKDELSELMRAFQSLDLNCDGKLDREELIQGFYKCKGDMDRAVEIVDKIMLQCDADGSGEIDYSEWVVATINKKKLLSDEKLEAAFQLFDKVSLRALQLKGWGWNDQCLRDQNSDGIW